MVFDKRASTSIFNKKFKFSTFFTSTASFMLSFTINFVNNVSNNDYYYNSMNFFVIIINFRRFLINVEKTHNRKHRRKNDLCLYYDKNDYLFKNCSHKFKSQLRIINFVVFSSSITFTLLSKIFDSKNVWFSYNVAFENRRKGNWYYLFYLVWCILKSKSNKT